jgi:hypothetical protein
MQLLPPGATLRALGPNGVTLNWGGLPLGGPSTAAAAEGPLLPDAAETVGRFMTALERMLIASQDNPILLTPEPTAPPPPPPGQPPGNLAAAAVAAPPPPAAAAATPPLRRGFFDSAPAPVAPAEEPMESVTRPPPNAPIPPPPEAATEAQLPVVQHMGVQCDGCGQVCLFPLVPEATAQSAWTRSSLFAVVHRLCTTSRGGGRDGVVLGASN